VTSDTRLAEIITALEGANKSSGGTTGSPPRLRTSPTRKRSAGRTADEPNATDVIPQRDSRTRVAVWNRLGIFVAWGSLSKVISSLTVVRGPA